MKQFPPRENHKSGDRQRLVNGKEVCVLCDSNYATVFDDFCDTCWSKFKVVEI